MAVVAIDDIVIIGREQQVKDLKTALDGTEYEVSAISSDVFQPDMLNGITADLVLVDRYLALYGTALDEIDFELNEELVTIIARELKRQKIPFATFGSSPHVDDIRDASRLGANTYLIAGFPMTPERADYVRGMIDLLSGNRLAVPRYPG